ncbi:MAG: hypothetical protein M1816_007922 [Peltula sp. TS41687]|nr:MAG: hypothetical protein M1816_007922 [Peltula sp. TS41687]
MRNLKNIRCSMRTLPTENVTATAWDPTTDSLLCVSGPSGDKNTITIQRWKSFQAGCSQNGDLRKPSEYQTITSWDGSSPSESPLGNKILNFHCFADDKTACVVLAGGDIIIVREEPQPGEEEVEIVGSVDAGITAAEWSPDEELLAISTHANGILFMTRDFESAGETLMATDDLKVSKHVSVGWGKAETQFKGKRAKALRDPTIPENVDSGTLSSLERGHVTISWRGDGAFMAISTVESDHRRVIRVYTREGHLDSVSEPVDGLEGALSWRPAGNLIAGIQRKENEINVVFFERNGLRHGQFSLRLDQKDMNSWTSDISLQWNIDSTVLAVSFKDRVQLWTMGNYHWYMKQEIKLREDHTSGQLALVTWHASVPLRLAVSLPDCLAQLEYAFMTAGGSTIAPHDLGVLAVVDGCVVKLTSLRMANIPPPMASHEITFASPVLDVGISRNGTIIAALQRDGLDVFEWFPNSKSSTGHLRRGRSEIKHSFPDFYPQQIAFMGDSNIFISSAGSSYSIVSQYLIDQDGLRFHQNICQSDLAISRVLPTSDHQTICVADGTHQVIEYRLDTGSSPFWEQICRWPAIAPWLEIIHLQTKTIAFGLLHHGSLYANDRLLAKNCTSMLVTSAHLIFTTTQHLLKFVHLTNLDDLAIPADEPEKDERCRSIERGEPELLERAVEHICFLADVNQLYDQALGLYDLDLALTIAQQSQKDPREYLPFLQRLQQLPLLRRQFSIDDHLGRHHRALSHLQSLRIFEEFKAYMVKHGLYQAALNMYKYERENMKEIMALYAEHLENQSRFKEAGLAYEFVHSYKRAMEAYRAAGCWQEALFCASQASIPQSQIDQLAMALADTLFETKDYTHAASLYLEYGHDVEKAASTLCKGYQYAEAMRLVVSRGKQDLLDSLIDIELGAGMANITELLADCKGQINAQVPRLKDLRANKEKDPLAYYDDGGGGGGAETDVPDNVSIAATDTSTSASLFTRYTNNTGTLNTTTSRRTSKHRRREERKRARGKKGSVYEEEYLVNSIRRLIDRVNGTRDEITRLIEGLLRRGMWERAMAVEKAMKEVVELCQGCVKDVFEVERQDNSDADGDRPSGADGVLFDSRQEANAHKEAPVVQGFEKMTLLGM